MIHPDTSQFGELLDVFHHSLVDSSRTFVNRPDFTIYTGENHTPSIKVNCDQLNLATHEAPTHPKDLLAGSIGALANLEIGHVGKATALEVYSHLPADFCSDQTLFNIGSTASYVVVEEFPGTDEALMAVHTIDEEKYTLQRNITGDRFTARVINRSTTTAYVARPDGEEFHARSIVIDAANDNYPVESQANLYSVAELSVILDPALLLAQGYLLNHQ